MARKSIGRDSITSALASATDACVLWPLSCNNKGYAVYRNRSVARLVCEAAHGSPPDPRLDAAHSCGNGNQGCINPRHLRWATRLENMHDAAVHGSLARGERNGNAKLTPADVRTIRALRGQKTLKAIGEMFGVQFSAVSAIQRGTKWGWLL